MAADESTEIDLTKPRPRKPQDRKPKADAAFTFKVGGKTYRLPEATEEAALSVPGNISMDAVMYPGDEAKQAALGFHLLAASNPDPKAMAALRSLPTGEMIQVVGDWMGGSSGSSD